MSEQMPTIGRIVHYTLSSYDVDCINRRRKDARDKMDWHRALKTGAQVHIGNDVVEGQVYPMIITKLWGDTPTCAFNGSCFLDGNDIYWVTSTSIGEGPSKASWPARS